MKKIVSLLILALLIVMAGCTAKSGGEVADTSAKPDMKLVLATTSSTYNSGLLDVLNAEFQKKYNVYVEVHAVGTGAALRMAKDGEADLVLVHARKLEDEFLEQGYGVNRRDVMFNDFIIVGPKEDPAGIKGMKSAVEAFRKIANAKATFISRGDNSGTNVKELEIWKLAGIKPEGAWYQQSGQGMGNTLRIANEKSAYTLTDRGTFLAYEGKLNNLEIMVEGPVKGGDKILANPYGIIAVNPAKYPERNYQLAMLYIGFITSPQGQQIIKNYRKNGENLFYPSAIKEKDNYNQYLPVTINGEYPCQ